MTTIAWDGKILATDSRTCTSDSHIALHRVSVKIHPIKDGWVAGCGNRNDVLAAVRYLEAGMTGERPTFLNDTSAVFFIDRQQRCWHYGNDLRNIDKQHWPAKVAIGGGGELAWGAMHAGADAIKAVRIACSFDLGSGLPVQWVNTINGEEGQEQ